MTPRQASALKGLTFAVVGAVFASGATWAKTQRAIADKADKVDLEHHIAAEELRHDSLAAGTEAIAASLCVGEQNAYKRVLLQCAKRGIK